MTSKLTREENVQAVFDLKAGYTLGLADVEILKRVARIALAEVLSNRPGNDTSTIDRALPVGTQLYRHAQQPVVPENCVTAEHRRVIEMLLNVCGAAFELADDSCQQDVGGEDCHVVPDDAFQKLSDALDEIENTLPTEDIDRPDVFLAWSAMPRAALKSLLQAQPAPVVPDDVLDALQKVARIRLDLNDFDGDRRGIADCLGDAEEALIEVVNRRASMLAAAPQEVPDGK